MSPLYPIPDHPRAPTEAEKNECEQWFPALKGTNWAIYLDERGHDSWRSVHWALQVPSTPAVGRAAPLNKFLTNEFWRSDAELVKFFKKHGLEKTSNAAEADIDVFKAGNNTVQFSRRLDNGAWTSKLGASYLIKHERFALNSEVFGAPALHFKFTKAAAHSKITMASQPLAKPDDVTEEEISLIQAHAKMAQKPAPAHTTPAASTHRTAPPRPTTPKPDTHKAAPHKTTPPATTLPATTPATTTPATTTPPTTTPPATAPKSDTHETAPHTTTPPATTPAATAPPTATPPQTTTPKTTLPKTTTPETPLPKTNAPATTSPEHTPSAGQDNRLKREFDADWAAWHAAMRQPPLKFRSDPFGLLEAPTWQKIKILGLGVMPFIVQKLSTGKDDSNCILAIYDLDPSLHTNGTPEQQKASILKHFASKSKVTGQKLSLISLHKANLVSVGLQGAKLAAELLTDPLVQQVVKEGIHAVPHILDAYSRDGKHGKDLWIEILKQVHAIHAHSTDPNVEKKEFQDWLSSYLKPETADVPVEEPAAPEVPVEEPVPEYVPEFVPTEGGDVAAPCPTEQ